MTKNIIIGFIGFILVFTFIVQDTLMAKKREGVIIKWKSFQSVEELKVTDYPDKKNKNDDISNFLFKLRSKDKVLLEFVAEKEAAMEISYKIDGDDIVGEFKKGIPLFLAPEEHKKAGVNEGIKASGDETKTIRMAVTDDLLPGGTLTITFKKTLTVQGTVGKTTITKKISGNEITETETTTNAEKPKQAVSEKTFVFRIKDKPPWFFTSTGLVFTNESNHSIAFIKTSTIAEKPEGSEEEDVFTQKLGYKDKNENNRWFDLRPKQTLVQFIHFNLVSRIYFSLGVPVNKKIFTEPFAGFSYYAKFKKIGYAITAGAHFHKELTIDTLSGFEIGNIIDPTKLTAEEIPTKNQYKVRFFIGVSFKL
jgi:hypothetical protein